MIDDFAIFDSHFHIIDRRFPLAPNDGYSPISFSCGDYLKRMAAYNLRGGAVVSGSFQAFDQSYLLDALKTLGPAFVGVSQLPSTVSDEEILRLSEAGVRAVRFNLKRGGSEDIKQLAFMANRVYELAGWHVELYVDSTELPNIYHTLINLPAASVDHLGLSKAGFGTMIKLAENGIRIKATGFGRVDFDVKPALKELYSANPGSLMFGTDHPSTRASRPYDHKDALLVLDALGTDGANEVFSKNAIDFYRLQETTDHTLQR